LQHCPKSALPIRTESLPFDVEGSGKPGVPLSTGRLAPEKRLLRRRCRAASSGVMDDSRRSSRTPSAVLTTSTTEATSSVLKAAAVSGAAARFLGDLGHRDAEEVAAAQRPGKAGGM